MTDAGPGPDSNIPSPDPLPPEYPERRGAASRIPPPPWEAAPPFRAGPMPAPEADGVPYGEPPGPDDAALPGRRPGAVDEPASGPAVAPAPGGPAGGGWNLGGGTWQDPADDDWEAAAPPPPPVRDPSAGRTAQVRYVPSGEPGRGAHRRADPGRRTRAFQAVPAAPDAPGGPGRSWPGEPASVPLPPEPGQPDLPYGTSRTDQGGWEPPGPGGGNGTRGPRRGRPGLALVSVAVIAVTGAAAALVILSGRSHGTAPAAGPAAATASPAATRTASPAGPLPGYPGTQGSESVQSIASAGSTQVAVGSDAGRAAIWRRAAGGAWTLETSAGTASPQSGSASLTAAAHGPDGWVAAGNAAGGGPLVLTSPDGITWHAVTSSAFDGDGVTVTAAAAGSHGYVVTGYQQDADTDYAAIWWSPDLVNWSRAGSTIKKTVSSPASGMSNSQALAVTTVPSGFIAVGTHNGCHTAWLSSDGQSWQSYDIPKPQGTTDPVLSQVAVNGGVIVATGSIATSGTGQRFPLAVTSADGGTQWQVTTLGGPGTYSGPQGTVTALTASGSGFTAAGLSGTPGHQQPVTWTSADGTTWSGPVPATGGASKITALASSGGSILQAVTVPASPGLQAAEIAAPAS